MQDAAAFYPYIILVVLTAIPSWVLLKRVGHSRAWVLLSVVPLGMIIILWLVAFRRWSAAEKQSA